MVGERPNRKGDHYVKRVKSGNAALDEILGGGFPVDSTTLITGLPGTGKTVLAQSVVFHNATPEARALYVGTASEPRDRMLRYVQEFSFCDKDKIGDAIVYEDLGETLRTKGLPAAFSRIAALVKEHSPAFLVIDSFKALHAFAASEHEFRVGLGMLSALLSSLAITSFLVGEYGEEDIATLPEFAVADSIVNLELKKVGVRDIRNLRVSKLRGSSYLTGEHAFRVTADGLAVFPRLTTPVAPPSYEPAVDRVSTGVEALDFMLSDGLWRGSSTVVFGPTGSGKTLMGLHFVFKGIERGEKGLIATMQDDPTQLARIVSGFGWDLGEAISSGMLTLLYASPVDMYIDEFLSVVSATAAETGSKRILVDSLTDVLAAAPDPGRFRDFMYSFTQAMAVTGVSLFMTQEVGDVFATTIVSQYGISHMSDNVILLGFAHEDTQVKHTITVIKTRASKHDPHVRRFEITAQGIRVGEPYRFAVTR